MTAQRGRGCLTFLLFGAVAQLVERVVRNDEAVSSNLIGSTSRLPLFAWIFQTAYLGGQVQGVFFLGQ